MSLEKVQNAIVTTLADKGSGRGVLVGDLILTAAHTIDWHSNGDMALSPDDYRVPIRTATGKDLMTSVKAVEPVSDIAVLGAVDGQRGQESSDQCISFQMFCESTTPVHLVKQNPEQGDVVFGFDLKSQPIRYTVKWPPFGVELCLDGKTDGGMSGGPVVTEHGQLVGIISSASGDGRPDETGVCVRPYLALPIWVLNEIECA